jgi:8-oxo-dGTP pyrophosphatase MutT (NUDIX family)
MKLNEIRELRRARPKAGFLPYFKNDEGQIEFLFMVSSDPMYGGGDPAVAKGKIDTGENVKTASLREGEEELGLRQSNLIGDTVQIGWSGEISGLDATYEMTIYIGEVKNKSSFDEPDHEVAETKWLTLDQFNKEGRKSHRRIVQACYSKINS